VLLNPEPTFEAIESAGGRVTTHSEAHVPAGFFFSGEIERVTSYEAGFVGHHTVRDGYTAPDPLILDDRCLVARVRGRGQCALAVLARRRRQRSARRAGRVRPTKLPC
jgi:7,8-dihydropterin-6-yl-methyl-4-(beta-D-ribofuranosyl)aminobenzene 5'-phosphate synthase